MIQTSDRQTGVVAALNALGPVRALLVVVCFVLSVAWLGIAVRFGMVPVKAPLVDRLGGTTAGDFMYFYPAAVLSSHGQAADVYDQTSMTTIAREKLDPRVPDLVWPYPPTMSVALAPMGRLSPGAALAVWVAIGVGSLLAVGRLTLSGWRWTLVVLLFPASALALFTGQFSPVIALLLTAVLVLLERAPTLAGISLGLFVLKPQFALAPLLALLMSRQWRAALAAAATSIAVVTLSLVVFGLAPWTQFFSTGLRHSQVLDVETPLSRFVTLFAALHSYGFSQETALIAHVLISVPIGLAALQLWHRAERQSYRALGLSCAALIITPYALDYDLVLLLAPWCYAIKEACEDSTAAPSLSPSWLALTLIAPFAYMTQLYSHVAVVPPVLLALALGAWWKTKSNGWKA